MKEKTVQLFHASIHIKFKQFCKLPIQVEQVRELKICHRGSLLLICMGVCKPLIAC